MLQPHIKHQTKPLLSFSASGTFQQDLSQQTTPANKQTTQNTQSKPINTNSLLAVQNRRPTPSSSRARSKMNMSTTTQPYWTEDLCLHGVQQVGFGRNVQKRAELNDKHNVHIEQNQAEHERRSTPPHLPAGRIPARRSEPSPSRPKIIAFASLWT